MSRQATLISLIKQTLGSLDLLSMLEPRRLYRTDGKRPDGVTILPWELGKQLVWEVTVVDALAPSRLNQGSSCNPGTTATEAEARKMEKYRELIDNGYILQPMALEVQGSSGESSEFFITCLCKNAMSFARRSTSWQFFEFEAMDFNGSSDRQCCRVLGTAKDTDAFKKCIANSLLNLYIIVAFKQKRSTGRLG